MNEHVDFERLVAGHIANEGASPPSDAFYEQLFSRAGGSRQRPEWLALIKEPPMRSNSHTAVGSPTARVMAALVATLLLALALAAAGAGAQQLLAAGPLVVAADGSGDYTTIQAAVDAAEDGDEILVRPGQYLEAVLVDRDIAVTGDGPVEDIIITAPESGPTSPTGLVASTASAEDPYALLISEADATISGLTFSGEDSAVHARGGAPTLEGLVLDGVGLPNSFDPSHSAMVLGGGTRALVRANTLRGGGDLEVYDGSEPVIEDNSLVDGPSIVGGYGDGAVVRGNTITRPGGNGLVIANPTSALIEANVLQEVPETALFLFKGAQVNEGRVSVEFDPTIRGNSIDGATNGIGGLTGLAGMIIGNEITAVENTAITGSSDVTIADNVLHGNDVGILVTAESPTISGNTITDGRVGIALAGGMEPVLTSNTVCDNETNVMLIGDAEPTIDASNEICEDAVSE